MVVHSFKEKCLREPLESTSKNDKEIGSNVQLIWRCLLWGPQNIAIGRGHRNGQTTAENLWQGVQASGYKAGM